MEPDSKAEAPGGYVSSYDEIPYESNAFPQTHPERLAVIARLFGLPSRPPANCRVLELGCAGGGNLIPLAYSLPGGEFVGIDYSRRHVERAEKTIKNLCLKNIRVSHGSILDIDASWGLFDYIVCHGVFSWVADPVQDKILALSMANLAPAGVAYISYNTYPGWHMREMIRDMMTYHAAQFADSGQKISQSRALIDFLARSVPTSESPYGLLLKSELELIKRSRDDYLFHEHLEKENSPVYFHRFIEKAEKHGLQYLGEAEFGTMLTSGFSREVAETLARISPQITRTEQYMDFLRNRMFRQTLLCHAGATLKRNIGPGDLEGLFFASAAAPVVASSDPISTGNEVFKTPQGATMETSSPLTKAAFLELRESWPRALDMTALLSRSLKRLKAQAISPAERQAFQNVLLQCYWANIVEFHVWQRDFPVKPGPCPLFYPLAAYQLAEGLPLVNQRHEPVGLDPVARELAPLLDGKSDRNTLLEGLRKLLAQGKLSIKKEGKPLADEEEITDSLVKALEQTLEHLARTALLAYSEAGRRKGER